MKRLFSILSLFVFMLSIVCFAGSGYIEKSDCKDKVSLVKKECKSLSVDAVAPVKITHAINLERESKPPIIFKYCSDGNNDQEIKAKIKLQKYKFFLTGGIKLDLKPSVAYISYPDYPPLNEKEYHQADIKPYNCTLS